MTEHDFESQSQPLPPELDALLSAERAAPELDAASRRRLHDRVAASVAILAAASVGAAATAGSLGSGGATALASTSTASGGGAGLSAFFASKIVVGIAAFVIGGVAGAGVHAYATRSDHASTPAVAPQPGAVGIVAGTPGTPGTPIVASAQPPAASPAVVAPPTLAVGSQLAVPAPPSLPNTAPLVAGIPSPSPVPTVSGANVNTAAANSGANSGAVGVNASAIERGLLEVARSALARGDSASALASLDEHAKRFPQGTQVQEREALAVQALVRAGRTAEARARGDRFKKSYPASLYLPSVNAALESIP